MTREKYIGQVTNLSTDAIQKTVQLLNEGGTIPFIARYRKEQTGNLDEVEILKIQDASSQFDEILKRKKYILDVLAEKGINVEGLVEKITNSFDLNVLEDLYLPYKSKRKTKVELALNAGLDTLAKIIMKQGNEDPIRSAQRFVSSNFPSAESAIEGAMAIMADWMNENLIVRERLRSSFIEHGVITAKLIPAKEAEADKYRDFFDFSQRLPLEF